MPISLQKVGFEYGSCTKETITGKISWFEIQYTQIQGVQKVAFEDEARTWSFGYEIEGQAKVTKRYEFGDDKQWIGIHGVESSRGIEKLGIITFDPTCQPLNGELQKDPEEESKPDTEEEGKDGENQIEKDPNKVD